MQHNRQDGGRDRAAVLAAVCAAVGQGRADEAAEIVQREYPFAPVSVGKRRYTETQCMQVFVRDGFIDRYSGQRLVFPGTLRLISMMLPTQIPFHNNWKVNACHQAFWDLFPTIDHIQPIAHGGEDAHDNWVSTSMVRNSAKANFALDQLGWDLHPSGDMRDWDGLTGWFLEQVDKNEEFLASPYLRRWRSAAVLVNNDYASSQLTCVTTSPLERLAAYLPVFTTPGFSFGHYVTGPATFPYYDYSGPADDFFNLCHHDGWVRSDFDWPDWKGGVEAEQLFSSPDAVAKGTSEQLSKMLTVILTQEKFCDGAYACAFESGLITAILRRAVQLADGR